MNSGLMPLQREMIKERNGPWLSKRTRAERVPNSLLSVDSSAINECREEIEPRTSLNHLRLFCVLVVGREGGREPRESRDE